MMLFGLFATFSFNYVAPTAIEGIAEKAVEANERQVQAALQESKNRELAKDGWGYESNDDFNAHDERIRDRQDGWAAD